MRAIVQSGYGLPDVLRLTDVARPAPGPDGVLVQVVAVALHKGDWHLLTGTPYLLRIAGFGLLKPKQEIPGMAVAGRVLAVGEAVREFAPGDAVFGELKGGGFAEVVCASASEWCKVPDGVRLEDAASLPVSATTALQGLRDAGKLQAGETVLINGAAGGVGAFAVQIAKSMGARVVAVCSARNAELVRSLGADEVVDYAVEDFTAGARQVDVVLDLVGNVSASACRRALKPSGRLVSVSGGAENGWTGPLLPILAGMISNLWSAAKFVPLAAAPRREDLAAVAALVASGAVRPVIEVLTGLAAVPGALADLGRGHSRGKRVIVL